MWLRGSLIWLCDVSRWSGDTIQGLWWTAALAATTNEQFAYVWPLASERRSINHTSAIVAVGFQFCCSPLHLSHSPLRRLSLCSVSLSCFLSSTALRVFLSLLRLCLHFFFFFAPSTYHLSLFSSYLSAYFLSVNSTDSEFSKTAKCFYIKGSFASHSWCGGEPACSHRGRGRDWCWRATTVRLSSALVPLGGTCTERYFMSNLPYLSLIFKNKKSYSILTVLCSNKTALYAGFSVSLFGLWLHKFKGTVWNTTSSLGDVIWGRGEKV